MTDQWDESIDIFESKTSRTLFRTISSLPKAEAQANAQLAACLPELLEAAKVLARLGIETCPRCGGEGWTVQKNEACGQCGGTGKDTSNPHPDDIMAARAAIAKATT